MTWKLHRLSDDGALSESILGWTVNGSIESKDINILQSSISIVEKCFRTGEVGEECRCKWYFKGFLEVRKYRNISKKGTIWYREYGFRKLKYDC